MIIILTLDDKNAVSFAGKRQASDRTVADYMSNITKDAPLYIKEKSGAFFKNCSTPPTLCTVDSFDNLKDGDVCFMEEVPSTQLMAQAEKLIIADYCQLAPVYYSVNKSVLRSNVKNWDYNVFSTAGHKAVYIEQ